MIQTLINWIDARFPLSSTLRAHLTEYYAPKNFNFWYYFGSLALLVLVIQIVSGIFLTMSYKPDAAQAFGSVEYIMRDVPWGWLIRYIHSTGASMFFVVVYLHMFRGLLYGSFRKPRELVWLPEYQRHPNTVTGIAAIVVATPNPAATAGPYTRIFSTDPKMDQWGDITVDAGKWRQLRFISPDRARVIYGGAVAPQGDTYVAALELWVEATGRTAAVLAQNGVLHDRPSDGRVRVRAEHAAGVVLDFVEMKR